MNEILFLLVLVPVVLQTWRNPWHGVLVLCILTYLSPQSFLEGPVRALPVFTLFYLLTFISWLVREVRYELAWWFETARVFANWQRYPDSPWSNPPSPALI